jgi:homoaconitase/3-isopropylmalate dehydratase large subunit
MSDTSMIWQLLKEKSGKNTLTPGGTVTLRPDCVVLTPRSLEEISDVLQKGRSAVPAILVNDHLPMEGGSAPEDLETMESCGVEYYGIGRGGTPAMVAAEEGLAVPGGIVVTNDKNLLELGAFGTYTLAAGPREIAGLFEHGSMEVTVPLPFGIELDAALPEWSGGIDIALYLTAYAKLPENRSTVLEFYGDGLEELPLPERHNMLRVLIDLGYEHVLCRVDEKVMAFLQDRSKAAAKFYFPEHGQKPAYGNIRVDLSNIHPMIAWMEDGEVKTGNLTDRDDLPVQHIFIGGDTACRFSDLESGMKLTRYRALPPYVTANIIPGSQLVYNDLLDMGVASIYTEIGFVILPPAFLGFLGAHPDRERTRLGTSATILLSGGLLANAPSCFSSAMTGRITHPLELESALKRDAERGQEE